MCWLRPLFGQNYCLCTRHRHRKCSPLPMAGLRIRTRCVDFEFSHETQCVRPACSWIYLFSIDACLNGAASQNDKSHIKWLHMLKWKRSRVFFMRPRVAPEVIPYHSAGVRSNAKVRRDPVLVRVLQIHHETSLTINALNRNRKSLSNALWKADFKRNLEELPALVRGRAGLRAERRRDRILRRRNPV